MSKTKKNLIERDIPKRPYYEGDGYADGYIVYDIAYCPCCNKEITEDDDNWLENYCSNCGQRLDWSDVE